MTSNKEDFVLQQMQTPEPKLKFGNVASYEPSMGDILNKLMGHRISIESDQLTTADEIINSADIKPVDEYINPNEATNSSQLEQITVFNRDLPFLFSLSSHEFITAAYSVILNRAPDESGQKYYQQRLNDGISRTEILGQLAASGETEDAKNWYQKYRHSYLRLKWRRSPIIGWGCEWITAFTHDHLRELLVHHDEQFVNNAFQSILGRTPDANGLEHYLTMLRAGQNKITILVDIKLSTEGRAAGHRVAGLSATSWLHRLRHLPVVKWIVDMLMLPKMVIENLQRTRRIELLIGRNEMQRQSIKESVIVLGAGGHAKVVIEILRAVGYQVSYCVGGADSPDECMGVPVLHGDEHLHALRHSGYSLLFPAIGSNERRERAAAHAVNLGYQLVNAISPHAIISPSIVLGKGIAIMSGAVINAQSTIEDLAIINTGATVDHDCHIGFCAHVAPQCALAGNVTIGPQAFVGIGTSIIPNKTIGNQSIIGAGSVVISDIPSSLTALGNPAKIVYKEGVAKGPKGPIFGPAVLRRTYCTSPLLDPNPDPFGPFSTPSKEQKL